jgi:hypothetical protein
MNPNFEEQLEHENNKDLSYMVNEPEQKEEEIESGNDENLERNIFLNPKDIKIEVKQLVLQNILDRLEYNEISFYTEYQRAANLWKANQQSLLIESILLQLPLPAFYFDIKDDAKWEVVDGLQRLSAIRNFVFGQLRLDNVEYLGQIKGCTFDQLPREMQRRFKEFNITAYLINKDNPPEIKFNLFKRINTGGMVLTPQEIRHALNAGVAAEFLKELAEDPSFKQATDGKIRNQRMEDRDFVNRFLAFFILGEFTYGEDMDAYMSKALQKLKQTSEQERDAIRQAFRQSMKLAHEIFGEYAFRKRYDLSHARKYPINKALFEVVSVSFARLNPEEVELLKERKDLFQHEFVAKFNASPKFRQSIETSTGDKSNVLHRHEILKHLINQVLHDHQTSTPEL